MALQYYCTLFSLIYQHPRLSPSGVSGGAMVLGNLPGPGRPTIRMIVWQGPIALAVDAGGDCLDIFTLLYPLSSLSPSLWETTRYGLKCCLKVPLNQTTNQPALYFQLILIDSLQSKTNVL